MLSSTRIALKTAATFTLLMFAVAPVVLLVLREVFVIFHEFDVSVCTAH